MAKTNYSYEKRGREIEKQKNKKKSVKKSLIKRMKIKKRESQSLNHLKMIRGIEIYKRADDSTLKLS
jgi:hypothetical protein